MQWIDGVAWDLRLRSAVAVAIAALTALPARAQPQNDRCEAAPPLVFGTTVGSTSGATADGASVCDTEEGGPDVWYTVTLAEPGVIFLESPPSPGLSLSLRRGCGQPEVACSQAVAQVDQRATLRLDFEGGETYWVRVATQDFQTFPTEGPFSLTLGPGGSIGGTVRDQEGALLEGIRVLLGRNGGGTRATLTDADGHYLFSDLSTSSHVLYAGYESAYLAEVWDDQPCAFLRDCEPGTPVEIALGQHRDDLDFQLELGAVITGRVTDDDTGLPVSQVGITLAGDLSHVVATDADGVYRFEGLDGGTYSVRSDLAEAYRPEVWDDQACSPFGCEFTEATPIEVARGGVAEGIDFGLDRGATITGRLVDGNQAGISAALHLLDTAGGFLVRTFTSSEGDYSFGRLNPGSYLVRTASEVFVNELWDDVPCGLGGPCELAAATPIVAGLGTPVSGVDFELVRGGVIAGSLRDALTGAAIPDGRVELYGATGDLITVAFAGPSGDYQIGGLASASYRLRAYSEDGDYEPQLYEGIACPEPCDATTGSPVEVETGEEVTIDFALELAPVRCDDEEFSLCLNGRRFAVRAAWRAHDGTSGFGHAGVLDGRDDSGYFWFFDAENVELVVKVLDACVDPYQRFWFFAAGLTNVEVELTVTDVQTGQTRSYGSPLGQPFQPLLDTDAFDSCQPPGHAPGGSVIPALESNLGATHVVVGEGTGPTSPCVPSAEVLCLGADGRFRVEAFWVAHDGTLGPGVAVPLRADTGLLWFFDPANVEVVVKVLDACVEPYNRFWVFASGLTNVAVGLQVTDTLAGETRVYDNPLGVPFLPIQDTQAFDTCGLVQEEGRLP